MIQLDSNITLVVGESYQLTVNNLELTLPYSEIKQSISISLGTGVTSYKLKFVDLGNGYKVQGLISGVSIKAGKETTLTNPVELKSYRRGTVTYWSIEVLSVPVVIEDNNVAGPDIGLMAIDPNNINTTDDIPEGVVNLYYTDDRAREALSATAPILYNNTTGVISTSLTQYTNANVGTLFTNGVHQGVSFNVGPNSISATVSLNTYSLDDLADVQLGQLGLQTGQVLKYSVNKWINTKLLSTELSDTALLMRRADNLSGLASVPTARLNLGLGSAALLDADVVLTTSSDIGDLGNVILANLANGHTLKYNSLTSKWTNTKLTASDIDGINGIYAPINSPTFTGIPLAPTPANNSNSTQIPTTAWVKARIAEGGGGGGGGATSLDQLTDVAIDDLTQVAGQTLRFNGVQYVNTKLASTDLSNTADILLKSGNLAGLNNNATARNNLGLGTSAILDTGTGVNQILKFTVANVLPAVSGANLTALGSINTLSDVDITGIVNGQILKWDGTKFVEHTLEIADLSDGNTIASQTELDTTQTSIGLNANGTRPNYSSNNYILNTDSHHTVLGKLDNALANVENSLGTASTYDVGTANDHIPLAQDVALLNRNVNSFTGSIKIAGDGSQSLSLFNGIFPLFSVSGNGNVLTEGTLQVSGTSNLGNVVLQPAKTITNLLGGQVSFGVGGITTTGNINSHDITSSGIISGNSLTVTTTSSLGTASAVSPVAGNNSTRVATTEWVLNEISLATNTIDNLEDVVITDSVNNEFLKYDGTNWINSTIDTNMVEGLGSIATLDTTDVLLVANNLFDLSDVATARDNLGLGTSATKDAGTQAGNVLLISVNDTLPALSGVNLTGVLKTSQLGQVNGVASLDADGKLTISQLPAITFTSVTVVANEGDKPAPAPENNGSVYIVTGTSKTYISDGTQWLELLGAADLAIAQAQVEIDAMELAIGLDTDGTFIPFVATNYLNTAESITESLTLLDTELGSVNTTLNALGTASLLDEEDIFKVANAFSEIAGDNVAKANARTNLGLGSSSTKTAGILAGNVLLLDEITGGIDSSVLNLATTIGGINIADILTNTSDINALIDVNALQDELTLASTDLTDSDNLPRLDALLNAFSGEITASNLEVTGQLAGDTLEIVTSSNLAEAYASVPNPLDDSLRVPTTSWVNGAITTSLGSLNFSDLSDVDVAGILVGQTVVWDGNNFIPSDFPNYTDEEARNAVGTALVNGVHTNGVSFTNNDLADRIDLTIELSSSQLTDSNNIVLLDSDQTITGNKTFTGDLDFTGSASVLVSTDLAANGNEVANASFVRALINLAGGVTQLNDLTDVTINALSKTEGQTLRVDGTGQFVNTQLGIADLSDVDLTLNGDGKTLVWDGIANKFVSSDFPSTYTDEEARNTVGTALENGTHSGISFTNDDLNNVINAIVSISSSNIDLNELITALNLGTAAFANIGSNEGDVPVFGADGLLVGVQSFDYGSIADEPVEASLDHGFIV